MGAPMPSGARMTGIAGLVDAAGGREAGSDAAYRRAIRHCAEATLRMHWGEKLINKIFGRATQSHAAGLVLVMHHEAERGQGPRPTLAAIQERMGSARTLQAFFALLRLAGFLTLETAPQDRRVQYLVPSPMLVAGLRSWIVQHLTCCELTGLVAPGTAARIAADDAACGEFIGRSRAMFERTRAAAGGSGAWAWIDRYDCGDRIGMMLLGAHYDAQDDTAAGEPAWFAFSSRDLAGHLGVSRSHVRNVVNAAEAVGLVVQDRDRHRLALTPRFVAEARAWFLSFWGWFAEVVTAMERAGEAGPPVEPSPRPISGAGRVLTLPACQQKN